MYLCVPTGGGGGVGGWWGGLRSGKFQVHCVNESANKSIIPKSSQCPNRLLRRQAAGPVLGIAAQTQLRLKSLHKLHTVPIQKIIIP